MSEAVRVDGTRTTRNADLFVGAMELIDELQLRPCARLDLSRRVWVLCPETDNEYRIWFERLLQEAQERARGYSMQH